MATFKLAIRQPGTVSEASPVAAVEDVPEEGSLLFTVQDTEHGEKLEAILVRQDGEIHGWRNHCMHWTDERLDKGDGVTTRGDELLCARHGATFETDTGYCTYGPCEGATLASVEVTVEDGAIYLTDPDYEFVALGPAEDDRDLSSTASRRLDF